MNRYPVLATLLLWLIAGGTTLIVVGEVSTVVAPVWAMCMIGNLVAVRRGAPGLQQDSQGNLG